jgi:hypothetical protein
MWKPKKMADIYFILIRKCNILIWLLLLLEMITVWGLVTLLREMHYWWNPYVWYAGSLDRFGSDSADNLFTKAKNQAHWFNRAGLFTQLINLSFRRGPVFFLFPPSPGMTGAVRNRHGLRVLSTRAPRYSAYHKHSVFHLYSSYSMFFQ